MYNINKAIILIVQKNTDVRLNFPYSYSTLRNEGPREGGGGRVCAPAFPSKFSPCFQQIYQHVSQANILPCTLYDFSARVPIAEYAFFGCSLKNPGGPSDIR
jgi:hypothetical protein